jgi:phage-related protein
MIDPISLATFFLVGKVVGTVMTLGGLSFGVFKVINWLKSTFTRIDSNVVELKNSMDSHIIGLREDIKSQTTSITNELREQRADMRSFYLPVMMQMQSLVNPLQAAPARAKRLVKKK